MTTRKQEVTDTQKEIILEEIRNCNLSMVEAIKTDNKEELENSRRLLNSLIKLYDIK